MIYITRHHMPGYLTLGTSDDHLLKRVQGIVDGTKVRGHNKVFAHIKCVVNIIKHKIPFTSDKDIESDIMSEFRQHVTRKGNISKIRAMYGGDIVGYDYVYKGPYSGLMDHQKILYLAMIHSTAAGLLGEPGTGKTLAFLAGIDTLISSGKAKRALIVTLASLKSNVLDEMNAQTPDLSGVVLSGGPERCRKILNKSFKIKKLNSDYDVYIANYESMRSLVSVIPDNYFDIVILDEAHRIASNQSLQTKAILSKFETTKRKYISTGTLTANNLMSFYMPFRFMGGDKVPFSSYVEFRRNYMFQIDEFGYVWAPRSGANSVVSKVIGESSILFKKDDCLDLPELVKTKVVCDLGPEQQDLYNKIKKDLGAEIENVCNVCEIKDVCSSQCSKEIFAKNALVLMQKLAQIASGFLMDTKRWIDDDGKTQEERTVVRFKKNPKIDCLIDILTTIPDESKVIIWSHHVVAIEMVVESLEKKFGKGSVLSCYGSDNTYEKVLKFKSGKSRYMVANPSKMGVGQNMQFSDYQVFFSNSFSYILRDQAICRQYRQGQNNKVTVIDCVARATIDEVTLCSLDNKEDMSIKLTTVARCSG